MYIRFLIIIFFLFFQQVKAQDCYALKTLKSYEIEREENRAFLVEIQKDVNGISIFSRKKIELEGVDFEDIKIFSWENDIVLTNTEGYFWVNKEVFCSEPKTTPQRFATLPSVSQIFQETLFCIDGKWKQLKTDLNTQKWHLHEVDNFPNEPFFLENISKEILLLKDLQSVYLYHKNTNSLQEIPKIKSNEVQVKSIQKYTFIADKNQLYCIKDDGQIRNITADFKGINLVEKPFTQMRFVSDLEGNFALDFSDDTLWIFQEVRNRKLFQFQMVKNVMCLFGNKLFLYKGYYYRKFDDLLLGTKFSVNTSEVKNISKLKLTSFGVYYDTEFFYRYDEIDRKITMLPVDFQGNRFLISTFYTNSGAKSYQNPFWEFWATEKDIFYVDFQGEILKEFTHRAFIKDLKLAYIVDDKLLIENIAIRNLDTATDFEFVGSIVKEISPCDSFTEEMPKVSYEYYFKDKSSVYKYESGTRQLQEVSVSASSFDEKQMCQLFLQNKQQ